MLLFIDFILFAILYRIFTKEEIAELRKITLWDIIVNSTSIHPGEIQKDVFIFKETDPCPQPFQLNSSSLEPCNNLGTYDYFTGSEIGFVYSCVFLAFVPILGILAAYGVVKYQNSKRRRLKVKQEALRFVTYFHLFSLKFLCIGRNY